MQKVTITHENQPAALAAMGRAMADADVNIEVQYSDHDSQLVLVVDKRAKALRVAEAWLRGDAA